MNRFGLRDGAAAWNQGLAWTNLPGDALAFALAAATSAGRWVIIVDGADRAERLFSGLKFFSSDAMRIHYWPDDDVLPYDGFSPDSRCVAERIATLDWIDRCRDGVIIISAAALLRRVPNRENRQINQTSLQVNAILDRDELARRLTERGYFAAAAAEGSGLFARRGDVLDVWPIQSPQPFRIDFFDDAIEDIRRLDSVTRRPLGRRTELQILPAREERLDKATIERAFQVLGTQVVRQQRGTVQRRRVAEDLQAGIRFAAIEDFLPALLETQAPHEILNDFSMVVVHPNEVETALSDADRAMREKWEALDSDERCLIPPDERFAAASVVINWLKKANIVSEFPIKDSVNFGAQNLDGFSVKGGDLAPVANRLKDLARRQFRVNIVAEAGPKAQKLIDWLAHFEVMPEAVASPTSTQPGQIGWIYGDLRQGFLSEAEGLAFIPAAALFGERSARKTTTHASFDAAVTALSDLKEGDLLVHRLHGIGIYRGLVRIPIEREVTLADYANRIASGMQGTQTHQDIIAQDFIRVEYRDGDLLLLPVTRLDQISLYRGSHGDTAPKLDKLGGSTWATRRSGVRDAVLKMAQELLATQAKRALAMREPFDSPGPMYLAFEQRFPYDETPDQLTSIEAVNDDLSQDTPMDRLLCGDVGFGKTEVALRAAMRVVEGGKQVAILCPTTVLAYQHYQTFKERFEDFPVTVEMVSRFRSSAEEKEILRRLGQGEIDILIGTNRLLGRGVKWPRLGLVVLDEEHRFGVKHKEKLKKFRAEVDVLAMSATPIPRTLQMAMSGIRTMSVLATPPRDRLAVRTTVAKYGPTRISEAIHQELERNGQVFFVHNRVDNIDAVAQELASWVPQARYGVAHGQMAAEELEEILIRFIEREVDVLVASTIIESGVDLPNVNTMIIDRADRFGLAQLHQLRGRVGRGNQRGNCILLVPDGMSMEAKKRIRTLVENTDLGAGFRIAIADLEMRGAGNLVGDAQSGHIDAVGYDTWIELLGEAVEEARGQLDRQRIDPEVEIPVQAFIPEAIIPDVPERLSWYRRLSASIREEEIDSWISEMEGMAGELPEEIANLASLACTKIWCRERGIVRCHWLKVRLVFEFHPKGKIEAAKRMVIASPKRFQLKQMDEKAILEIRFLPEEAAKPFRFIRWVMAQLDR